MKLTKYFPGVSEAKKDVIHLLVVVVLYLIAIWAVQFIGALASIIPLLGWLFKLLCWVVRVYLGVGIIVAILAFVKVVD